LAFGTLIVATTPAHSWRRGTALFTTLRRGRAHMLTTLRGRALMLPTLTTGTLAAAPQTLRRRTLLLATRPLRAERVFHTIGAVRATAHHWRRALVLAIPAAGTLELVTRTLRWTRRMGWALAMGAVVSVRATITAMHQGRRLALLIVATTEARAALLGRGWRRALSPAASLLRGGGQGRQAER
jgi:hypothetical protein